MKGNRRPRRPSGSGRSLDTPSKGREKELAGERAPGGEQNRSKPVNPDAGYAGNVSGMCSKPVKVG